MPFPSVLVKEYAAEHASDNQRSRWPGLDPGDEAVIPLDAITPVLVLAGVTPGLSGVVVGVRGSTGTAASIDAHQRNFDALQHTRKEQYRYVNVPNPH
jgi:hypothetical protein